LITMSSRLTHNLYFNWENRLINIRTTLKGRTVVWWMNAQKGDIRVPFIYHSRISRVMAAVFGVFLKSKRLFCIN
jgi:hypothetical protein